MPDDARAVTAVIAAVDARRSRTPSVIGGPASSYCAHDRLRHHRIRGRELCIEMPDTGIRSTGKPAPPARSAEVEG
jgi:hypothetical protein